MHRLKWSVMAKRDLFKSTTMLKLLKSTYLYLSGLLHCQYLPFEASQNIDVRLLFNFKSQRTTGMFW